MEIQEIKKAAKGKWLGIIQNLGISVSEDPKKHTACPICGPGNNNHRFRFDNKDCDGTWICTQCGAGDGVSLVQKALGMTFPETLERIAEIVGYVEPDQQKTETPLDMNKRKESLNRLWTSGKDLSGSDQASKYLHSRGIVIHPNNVRFTTECWNAERKQKMCAMISKVQNREGKPVTIHRTYLDGAAKADVQKQKMLMPCTEKLCGAAVRLAPVGGDVLGVAEGIETSLAAMQLFFIPVWATISTAVMETFLPPEGVRRVVIFSDADSNFAGQKSAYRLANTLYQKDYIVDVQFPDTFNDFADIVEHEYKKKGGV